MYQGRPRHIYDVMESESVDTADAPRTLLTVRDERGHPTGDELAAWVAAALAGDAAAWNSLVEGLQRVVWKAVNMMTTDHEVRADAYAATWLRLAERLSTIREPHKLPGWLTTTATNETSQILRKHRRDEISVSVFDPRGEDGRSLFDSMVGDDGAHDEGLLAAERRREVREAFTRLDDACREIITVLVLTDPPLPYDEASERLGRPIGSLGPTRGRCLDKLKALLADHLETGTTND